MAVALFPSAVVRLLWCLEAAGTFQRSEWLVSVGSQPGLEAANHMLMSQPQKLLPLQPPSLSHPLPQHTPHHWNHPPSPPPQPLDGPITERICSLGAVVDIHPHTHSHSPAQNHVGQIFNSPSGINPHFLLMCQAGGWLH